MDSRRPTAVIFDLDGTLVDHFTVIYRCYCHALAQLGLPPVTFEKVKSSVGGSIPVTFGKLIPQAHVDEAVRIFREHLDEIWDAEIKVFPGVVPFVRRLHAEAVPAAVLTNKEGDRSRAVLENVGLATYFDFVLGVLDTPWRKPDPEFSRAALEHLGTAPEQTCLIGDSPYDIAAADAVGMISFGVATGSHSLDELRATPARATYPDMASLAADVFGYDLPADPGILIRNGKPAA
ncbi:MAG: HAD-IA family hydrolase [Opitutales bacterium]|nr:HAD-IA family hydrolase [Opitutales bacterium]